ncbi:MAG: hypothetical protein U0175_33010 [Caldilineaceae bacterium]
MSHKPLALIVFLENVGHIHGLNLPQWAMDTVDYVTEEYAKLLLHLYGAYRRYDQVIILEDERAVGPELSKALLEASRTHQVDVLLLVHGHEGRLLGYKGKHWVGPETFDPLRAAYQADPNVLDVRMVYGLNCYGMTLAETWMALGAKAVNGAVGVNWFPEPSLSVFLRSWLQGHPYRAAVEHSNQMANKIWGTILRPNAAGEEHVAIRSSRQTVNGKQDITIFS